MPFWVTVSNGYLDNADDLAACPTQVIIFMQGWIALCISYAFHLTASAPPVTYFIQANAEIIDNSK